MAIATRFTKEMVDDFTNRGFWSKNELITDYIDRHAAEMPDREALVDIRGRYTWAQLKRFIDRVALGLLDLGLEREDRVIVQLPNWAEWYCFRFGLQRFGGLPLFPMMTYRTKELENMVTAVEAKAIVVPGVFGNFDYAAMALELKSRLPNLKHVLVAGGDAPAGTVSVNEMLATPREEKHPADYLSRFRPGANDPYVLSATSGTTGSPKFGVNTANPNLHMGKSMVERVKLTRDDILIAIAPLPGGPSGTLCVTAAPIAGTRVVCLEKFDAEEALRLIERERVTIATGVPTQMIKMLAVPDFDKYDLSSLRAFFYAGSTLPPETAKAVNERMHARVLTVYGMIDAGIPTGSAFDDPIERQNSTVGRPLPGNEIRIVDDQGRDAPTGEPGEIWWRGATAYGTYYNNPEATRQAWTEDGWFCTGDMGTVDENGYVRIVGRKKDIIIRGGQNISPREIEDMLMTHPKVHDVAVVAMPDKVMVEKACAFVIPKAGGLLKFEEMIAHLRAKNIATYKLPERLEIVDAFPMSGGGQKIAKNLLREEIANKLRAEGKI